MPKILAVLAGVCCLMLSVAAPVALAGSLEEGVTHAWQGEINGKIPVSLWLEAKGDLLTGEIVYTKTGSNKPIRLLGTRENDTLMVHEMLPNGTISGRIHGKAEGDTFTGKWTAPDKVTEKKDGTYSTREGKTYSITLTKSGTKPGSYSWDMDPKKVTGTYEYSYGAYQGTGKAVIYSFGGGKAEIDVNAYTGAPSFNMAELDKTQVTVQGNTITHELEETCAFTARLYNDFLVITHELEKNCSGYFGRNANLAGTYLRQAK
jgi:hypothetical protein